MRAVYLRWCRDPREATIRKPVDLVIGRNTVSQTCDLLPQPCYVDFVVIASTVIFWNCLDFEVHSSVSWLVKSKHLPRPVFRYQYWGLLSFSKKSFARALCNKIRIALYVWFRRQFDEKQFYFSSEKTFYRPWLKAANPAKTRFDKRFVPFCVRQVAGNILSNELRFLHFQT